MTKTPDEIKKGLECASNCSENLIGCKHCPYNGLDCTDLHPDALALIQQLEAQVPRWISVEDEPPKNVYLQVYVAKFGCVEKAKYEGLLWRTSGGEGLNIDWVTHWMPLPEPPKEPGA